MRLLGLLRLVCAGCLCHGFVAWAGTGLPDDVAQWRVPPRTVQDVLRSVELNRMPAHEWARLQAVAAAEPPPEQDERAMQAFYRQRGEARRRLGRMAEAIADQREAAYRYANDDLDARLDNLIDLATYELRGGDPQKALAVLADGLSWLRPGFMGYAMTLHRLRVDAHVRSGDLAAAESALHDAQTAMAEIRRWRKFRSTYTLPHWEASLDAAQTMVLMQQGRWAEAEQASLRGLRHINEAIARYQEDMRGQLDSEPVQRRMNALLQNRTVRQLDLSRIHLRQGRLVEAELACRDALEQGVQVFRRSSVEVAMVLETLSAVLIEQGRTAQAVALAEEMVRTYEAGGAAADALSLWQGRRVLGAALVADRQYARADRVFRAAQAAGRMALGAGRSVPSAEDLDWAIALLQTQRPQQALALLQGLLAQASTRQATEAQLRPLQAFEAMARHALGQTGAARRGYEQAMPELMAQMRQDLGGSASSSQQRARWHMLLEDQLLLLAGTRAASAQEAQALQAQTFALADLARGSRVQRALQDHAVRGRTPDPALADAVRQVQDLQWRIAALEELLTRWLASAPQDQAGDGADHLRAEVERLKSEREGLQQDMARQFPDHAQATLAPAPSLDAVRQALGADEVLVSWYFAERQGLVWALTRDGPVQFQRLPLGRQALARQVRRLRQALAPEAATVEDIPAFDLALAHRLYRELLAPVQGALAGKRVLLAVPHGELAQLPLSVLVTRTPGRSPVARSDQAYRSAAWLMNDFGVAQLPSAAALLTLRNLPPASASRRAFAGFGDPVFSLAQAQSVDEPRTPTLQRRGHALALRKWLPNPGVSSAELASLPRLPDTREEVEQVGRALGADPAQDHFLQREASVARVLSTDLSQRRVLLFATHGLVPGDLNGLYQPALALSAPAVTGESRGDGLLTLDHVLGLKLDADWVVLSACNTAAGEEAEAEAMSGLGRAFFYAGARALLVSGWPVDSAAARQLMVGLFAHQQQHPGEHKARHLRAVMQQMLRSGVARDEAGQARYAYAHPLFWAPFMMVGD